MQNKLSERAQIIIEAIPYLKNYHDKIFVIKYGGAIMDNERLKEEFIQDIILLKYLGIHIVVVHGGGNEISSYLNRLGITTQFINGLRITDKETIDVVKMVLNGKINYDLVTLFNLNGGKSIGLSGCDGNLFVVEKYPHVTIFDEEKHEEKKIDLGFVGEIIKVDPEIIKALIKEEYIPVISPLGNDLNGDCYNINADFAASEIAKALKAEKLIMLTDVDGVYRVPGNPATKINNLSFEEATQMIANHEIKGGMIPKVQSCMKAITNGVKRTHIIDGSKKNSILLEIFTKTGIGTMITK